MRGGGGFVVREKCVSRGEMSWMGLHGGCWSQKMARDAVSESDYGEGVVLRLLKEHKDQASQGLEWPGATAG